MGNHSRNQSTPDRIHVFLKHRIHEVCYTRYRYTSLEGCDWCHLHRHMWDRPWGMNHLVKLLLYHVDRQLYRRICYSAASIGHLHLDHSHVQSHVDNTFGRLLWHNGLQKATPSIQSYRIDLSFRSPIRLLNELFASQEPSLGYQRHPCVSK